MSINLFLVFPKINYIPQAIHYKDNKCPLLSEQFNLPIQGIKTMETNKNVSISVNLQNNSYWITTCSYFKGCQTTASPNGVWVPKTSKSFHYWQPAPRWRNRAMKPTERGDKHPSHWVNCGNRGEGKGEATCTRFM